MEVSTRLIEIVNLVKRSINRLQNWCHSELRVHDDGVLASPAFMCELWRATVVRIAHEREKQT